MYVYAIVDEWKLHHMTIGFQQTFNSLTPLTDTNTVRQIKYTI